MSVAHIIMLILFVRVRFAFADSLSTIEHVVIFMQENRSWNNYFGTMAGTRGFADPNVQVNTATNKSTFYQVVNSELSNATDWLLPFYLGYEGGTWPEAVQCITAGSNSYTSNHYALNGGLNDAWATENTPWSWGHLQRSDIPVHFAIAEGWTVGDMYQESVIASTNPNRVSLVSGTIGVSESKPYIDNYEIDGCETSEMSCYPLTWTTIYEYYQNAGVTWQVYQDTDNFDDNPLAWFKNFQEASSASELAERGLSYKGLDAFYDAAANGTLPMISFIVGPTELSEHPPNLPSAGGWLQKQVVDAVVNGAAYNTTALMVSYDETGGFGDHVVPFHSENGTTGEWIEDPYGKFGYTYTGPGFRVPFYIISPWTRGGRVFTERADHNSQILFLEEWLTAKGYNNVTTEYMEPWRRQHMSNLVNAFDFSNPNYTLPDIPDIDAPAQDSDGTYVSTGTCESTYEVLRPTVPYGEQTETSSLYFEDGYKEVVGYLTEGRYLTFEKGGYALTNLDLSSVVSLTATTTDHSSINQRWILHYSSDEESQIYYLESAYDGTYLGADGTLVSSKSKASEIAISFLGGGAGYILQYDGSTYIDVQNDSFTTFSTSASSEGFSIYSVTFSDSS
ncbi:Phospholipase C [Penicillium tannophilum]|nr:Phospholipase C [Penicillium tannophilum]